MYVGSLSTSLTSLVGDHGLYAVFGLMLIDAVFPTASELVMLYGGAMASGALAGQSVTLFGYQFSSGLPAYFAVALAGTVGYTVGALLGWEVGRRGGRPFLEQRGRWLHLDDGEARSRRGVVRALGRLGGAARARHALSSARSSPSPPASSALRWRRYMVLTVIGSAVWAFAFAAVGWATGASWQRFDHAFRFADVVVAAAVVALVSWLTARIVRGRRGRTESAS